MTFVQQRAPIGDTAGLFALIQELFPICRSITGNGLRQTLRIIQENIPLAIREIPSGTQVFDWVVPDEWNVREAFIENAGGERIADFAVNNLHLVNYSEPVERKMSLDELSQRLHSIPSQPNWIPYRTSYYRRNWGFCLAHARLVELQKQDFLVKIDSDFKADGSLSYGELLVPGGSTEEVLISAHVCHPSLANDNLSSVAIAVALAQFVASESRRYSYRFLFAPGTIGAITWLALNPQARQRIKHGLVLALLGDSADLTYKQTRSGNAAIDYAVKTVLGQSSCPSRVLNFEPIGYDERQFGSPGIQLPIGRLSRSTEGGYPQYHTSADNLELVSPEQLGHSLGTLKQIVQCLESERTYRSQVPNCEPQLGRRGLYPIQSSTADSADLQKALLWNLAFADGASSSVEIAYRSKISPETLGLAAETLVQAELLNVSDQQPTSTAAGDHRHGHPSEESQALSRRAHDLIPGGAHTYAKGDDQFPVNAPRFFARGDGCHAYDTDGNRFIEYGIGLRAVSLGHAYRPVIDAAYNQMHLGSNFTRPTPIESELAEDLLELLPAADMVKFTKNGSDATTAAIRLARAKTGRERVLLCRDQPFFSVDDWFIGTTPMDTGIPDAASSSIVRFPYNDLEALKSLFEDHRGEFSCLIMEASNYSDPDPGYLHEVQGLCQREGTLFVLDEMITGFRWNLGGAQQEYDLQPDLSTFGKALGNGFSVAALAGKREHMELGGITHDQARVFLLSYTHGAETHCLAAAREVLRIYKGEPVIKTLYGQGHKLKTALTALAEELNVAQHFQILGRCCNLIYATMDRDGNRSQDFRTLLLQELIKDGIFAPSLVVSYSHSDQDIADTVSAFRKALLVYRQALDEGVDKFLVGRPSKPVFRKYN